jgi:hypothetical protein
MKSAKNKIFKNEIYNFPVNYTTKNIWWNEERAECEKIADKYNIKRKIYNCKHGFDRSSTNFDRSSIFFALFNKMCYN